jgi:hypothetical protein
MHDYCIGVAHRMGPDGADFPTSTYMLQYEEETDNLVESIWTASCSDEHQTATQAVLARSPAEQLQAVGEEKRRTAGRGGLPVIQCFTITPGDLKCA